MTNYYAVLCVTTDCSIEDIKRSYYALAKRYHPDNRETGDIKRMSELNKAYDVLSDPQKRTRHDHLLKLEKRLHFISRNKYIAQRFQL